MYWQKSFRNLIASSSDNILIDYYILLDLGKIWSIIPLCQIQENSIVSNSRNALVDNWGSHFVSFKTALVLYMQFFYSFFFQFMYKLVRSLNHYISSLTALRLFIFEKKYMYLCLNFIYVKTEVRPKRNYQTSYELCCETVRVIFLGHSVQIW
jgi:hypothetical protein